MEKKTRENGTTTASPQPLSQPGEGVNGGSPTTAGSGAQQASPGGGQTASTAGTPAEGGRAQNQAGTTTASPQPLSQPGEGVNGGSPTTAGSGKTQNGTKDKTQNGEKTTAGTTGGTQDGEKPENVVRDRSGNVVYDADGKPVTYGGGGKLTNVQLYELLNQPQELTPEEKKREKRQKLFAAIGDGISALSNLYFTTKGAPNMYSGKNTQSEKETTYWDKLRQDRENNRKRYVDGYLKALQADDLAAIRQQNADTQKALREVEAERKKAEVIRKDELAEAQAEVYKARAAKDVAAVELAGKTLEYMNMYGWELKRAKAQADIDLAKARREKLMAPAGGGRAQNHAGTAGGSGGSGGSGGKGKYYGTFNGVAYKTKADYDKAVVDYAKGNKIPLTYNKVSTDKYGRKRTTQTNRTVPGLAAAGEADYKAKQAAAARAKTPAEGGRAQNRTSARSTAGAASARSTAGAHGATGAVGSMGTRGSIGGTAPKGAASGAEAKAAPAATARPTYTHTKSLGL